MNKLRKKLLALVCGIVDQNKIDEINILNATKLAVKLAVQELETKPDVIMVDALTNMEIGRAHV